MTKHNAMRLVRLCLVTACLWLPAGLLYAQATGPGSAPPVRAYLENAAAALQAGQPGQAVSGLRAALADPAIDPVQRLTLKNQLGAALIAAGRPEEAGQVLHALLAEPGVTGHPRLEAAVRNNLAHLQQAQGDPDAALAGYRKVAQLARTSGNAVLQVKAELAAAGLLAGSDPDAAGVLLEQAWDGTQKIPDGRESAWLSIHNAVTLLQLAAPPAQGGQDRLVKAAERLQHAAAIAEARSDRFTAAQAWGSLGTVYERQQRYREALELTDRALFEAQQVRSEELRYRREWQRGRILQALGRQPEAIAAYRQATATLQSLRAEFAAGNASVSSALREDATPLYLALADLLLRASARETDPAREQALLREARETVELLKTTEVQDYFRDDCVAAIRARVKELDASLLPGTAVLYPIALPDRIELLLSLPSGLVRHTVPVDQATLVGEVHRFRHYLEKRTTRQYLKQSRQLYRWLIAPLEQDLQAGRIDTLVVVPGQALRTVPIAALNDGRDFLIRHYAIATTPSLRLTDPRPIRRQHVRLLLNGLTEARQGFPPLVHVNSELGAIHKLYGGKVFKDESYRKAAVEQELAERPYSIVHFATHGKFSGRVSDSFLLTWDGRMNMNDLEEFVGESWFRKDNPLELLTLSACETAEGDDTAALGLASVAIKAGARSALASLWSINDEASSELVSDFYARLKDPSVSKAQALRLAQLAFLDGLRYRHPAYWAPFLLIGNWL